MSKVTILINFKLFKKKILIQFGLKGYQNQDCLITLNQNKILKEYLVKRALKTLMVEIFLSQMI